MSKKQDVANTLFAAVAPLLPGSWTWQSDEPTYDYEHDGIVRGSLIRADGLGVSVGEGYGRYDFSADFSELVRGGNILGQNIISMKYPASITVSVLRTAAQIAKEIERRLLPGADATLEKARLDTERYHRREAAFRADYAALAALVPDEKRRPLKPDDTAGTLVQRVKGKNLYYEPRLEVDVRQSGPSGASIKVTVEYLTVEQTAHMIAAWHAMPGPGEEEGACT